MDIMKGEEDDAVLVVSSDSDEDDSNIWRRKCKNKQFQQLWKKVQPILFHHVLPEYKSSYFPYGQFKELAEDLRKSLTLVYVESTQAFIWKNLIRWLVSMKLCYEGISDLKYDERYNLILTDFMAQYMNYKCNLYSTITDETELCRRVDEILITLGVVFSGNIPSILMTLLKIEVKDVYRLILDPIFRKYLSDRHLHEPDDLISYIRLILCYRQWKKLAHFKEEKELINEIAVGKSERTLKSEPQSAIVDLTTREPVLPKMVPPVNETNRSFSLIAGLIGFAIRNKAYGTRILLINKSLDLEETIVKYFQQYEKFISRNDSTLCESARALRIFNDIEENSSIMSPVPQPMLIEVSKRSRSRSQSPALQNQKEIEHQEQEDEEEQQQEELQNEKNIDKQGNANKHLSMDCDIPSISKALNSSNLSSNSEQLSLSFKQKPQSRNSDVQLSVLNNDKEPVIEIVTTDDEDDDDDNDDDENNDNVDPNSDHKTVKKQTNKTLRSVKAHYIQKLKQRADVLGETLRRRNSTIVLSDEDEVVVPVAPARQASSSNTNATRSVLNPSSRDPEVNPIPGRAPRRMDLRGERQSRKEKQRCITGEVSSTTLLDCSSSPDAESSAVQNVGTTLENAREVGILSAVRTLPRCGSTLASTDCSDISDDDAGPSRLAGNRRVSRLCWSKFSKVVEEATSSTSEIPIRAGSETSSENVIFSIHPSRSRRSTSSSPCPTRTTSPTDSCPKISPSSTIKAGTTRPGSRTRSRVTSASRITVRRLNSLIGNPDDGEVATCSRYVGRPAPIMSFNDDSMERAQETRQSSLNSDFAKEDSVVVRTSSSQDNTRVRSEEEAEPSNKRLESEVDSEVATCSRYVVTKGTRKNSQGRLEKSADCVSLESESGSEVATCSRYVVRRSQSNTKARSGEEAGPTNKRLEARQSSNSSAGVSLESEVGSKLATCSPTLSTEDVKRGKSEKEDRLSASQIEQLESVPTAAKTRRPRSKSQEAASKDKQYSSVDDDDNNSDLNKFLNDISVHIGDSQEVPRIESYDTSNKSKERRSKSSKSVNEEDIISESQNDTNSGRYLLNEPNLKDSHCGTSTSSKSIVKSSAINVLNNQKLKLSEKQSKEKISQDSKSEISKSAKSSLKDEGHQKIKIAENQHEESEEIVIVQNSEPSMNLQIERSRKPESEITQPSDTLSATEIPNKLHVLQRNKDSETFESFKKAEPSTFMASPRYEDISIDTSESDLSTSLMEEELSMDAEIESPAYEPISPKIREVNNQLDEKTTTVITDFNNKIVEAQAVEDTIIESPAISLKIPEENKKLHERSMKPNPTTTTTDLNEQIVEAQPIEDTIIEDTINQSKLSRVQNSDHEEYISKNQGNPTAILNADNKKTVETNNSDLKIENGQKTKVQTMTIVISDDQAYQDYIIEEGNSKRITTEIVSSGDQKCVNSTIAEHVTQKKEDQKEHNFVREDHVLEEIFYKDLTNDRIVNVDKTFEDQSLVEKQALAEDQTRIEDKAVVQDQCRLVRDQFAVEDLDVAENTSENQSLVEKETPAEDQTRIDDNSVVQENQCCLARDRSAVEGLDLAESASEDQLLVEEQALAEDHTRVEAKSIVEDQLTVELVESVSVNQFVVEKDTRAENQTGVEDKCVDEEVQCCQSAVERPDLGESASEDQLVVKALVEDHTQVEDKSIVEDQLTVELVESVSVDQFVVEKDTPAENQTGVEAKCVDEEVQCSLSKDQSAVERPDLAESAYEDQLVVEEQALAEDHTRVEDKSIIDDQLTVELVESVSVDQFVVEKESASEDQLVVENQALAEDHTRVEDKSIIDDQLSVELVESVSVDQFVVEKESASEDQLVVEKQALAEDHTRVEVKSIVEDQSTVELVESVSVDQFVVEKESASEDQLVVEKQALAEDHTQVEDKSIVEDQLTVEHVESVSVDQFVVEKESASEDRLLVEKQALTEDHTQAEDKSIVEDQLIVELVESVSVDQLVVEKDTPADYQAGVGDKCVDEEVQCSLSKDQSAVEGPNLAESASEDRLLVEKQALSELQTQFEDKSVVQEDQCRLAENTFENLSLVEKEIPAEAQTRIEDNSSVQENQCCLVRDQSAVESPDLAESASVNQLLVEKETPVEDQIRVEDKSIVEEDQCRLVIDQFDVENPDLVKNASAIEGESSAANQLSTEGQCDASNQSFAEDQCHVGDQLLKNQSPAEDHSPTGDQSPGDVSKDEICENEEKHIKSQKRSNDKHTKEHHVCEKDLITVNVSQSQTLSSIDKNDNQEELLSKAEAEDNKPVEKMDSQNTVQVESVPQTAAVKAVKEAKPSTKKADLVKNRKLRRNKALTFKAKRKSSKERINDVVVENKSSKIETFAVKSRTEEETIKIQSADNETDKLENVANEAQGSLKESIYETEASKGTEGQVSEQKCSEIAESKAKLKIEEKSAENVPDTYIKYKSIEVAELANSDEKAYGPIQDNLLDKSTEDTVTENELVASSIEEVIPEKSIQAEVTQNMPIKNKSATDSIQDVTLDRTTKEISIEGKATEEITCDKPTIVESNGGIATENKSITTYPIEDIIPDKCVTIDSTEGTVKEKKVVEINKEKACLSAEISKLTTTENKFAAQSEEVLRVSGNIEAFQRSAVTSHQTQAGEKRIQQLTLPKKLPSYLSDYQKEQHVIQSTKLTLKTQIHGEFSRAMPTLSEKSSTWSNEAELPIVLNLRRTELALTEEDSNLSTQVQVAAEDLGDPILSFDSGDNSPAYGFETPRRDSPLDYDSNRKTTFVIPAYATEDQEVSTITSQGADTLTYNTYHEDCDTPVLDEKDAEEVESPTTTKIVSLSVLKELPTLPPIPSESPRLLTNQEYQFSNQISTLCPHVPRSLPKSAGALVVENPNHFASVTSISQININQEDPGDKDDIATTPTTTESPFIEPSPKPDPNIEMNQRIPLKIRLKRRISQSVDIIEEFNLGANEPIEPITMPLPSYNVPLDLVMRSDKHSKRENVAENIPQTLKSDKDPLSVEEEDRNQKSWLKKLGISKTSHKTVTQELHSPTMTVKAISEDIEANRQEASTFTNPPETTQVKSGKNEGRRRKPRRVKKLTDQSEIVASDSSAERYLVSPIQVPVASQPIISQPQVATFQSELSPQLSTETIIPPIVETAYNPEDIKAATILSDMLKKSNKVDERLQIEPEMPTKLPKTLKQKNQKKAPPQFTRLTRSTSQLMEKLPFSDTPITPPAISTKSTVKKISAATKGSANKKRARSESIWQQEKTQEILRSFTIPSENVLRTSDSDEKKNNITENLAASESFTHSKCSSDSDDTGKLVIDLGKRCTFDSKKQKTKAKTTRHYKRKAATLPKSEMKKDFSPSIVKYDEGMMLSPNSVFQLTPEVDVYLQALPKTTDDREDITISRTKPVFEQKSSDDEVARLYPIVQLTENVEFTPKTRRKQTSTRARGRAIGRKIFDLNKTEEYETKLDAKSRTISKSKRVAQPKPNPREESRFDTKSKTATELKLTEEVIEKSPLCKPADELGTSPEAKTKARPKERLSFSIDVILGNRMDSPQSVEKESPPEIDKETPDLSTSPQITMNKEMWLTNFSLRKTGKSLNEVVKVLSEAKPNSPISPTVPLTTPCISKAARKMFPDQILLQDLKSSISPTDSVQSIRVKNRRKSLVTAKTKSPSRATSTELVQSNTINSETDILKIKEELKQLQPIRNRRKSRRSTVKIVNADPKDNSEDNEPIEERNRLKMQNSEEKSKVTMTLRVSQGKPDDNALKSANPTHTVQTPEETQEQLKEISEPKENGSVEEALKCTNVKSPEETEHRIRETSETNTGEDDVLKEAVKIPEETQKSKETSNSKATRKSKVKKSAKDALECSGATDSEDTVKAQGDIQKQLKAKSESKAPTKQKKLVEDSLKCTDTTHSAGTVKIPEETQKQLQETSEPKSMAKTEALKVKTSDEDVSKCSDVTQSAKKVVLTPKKTQQLLKDTSEFKVDTKPAAPKQEKSVDDALNALKCIDASHSTDTVMTPEENQGLIKETSGGKATTKPVVEDDLEDSDATHSEKTAKIPEETQKQLKEALKPKVTTKLAAPKYSNVAHSEKTVEKHLNETLESITTTKPTEPKCSDITYIEETVTISEETQKQLKETSESKATTKLSETNCSNVTQCEESVQIPVETQKEIEETSDFKMTTKPALMLKISLKDALKCTDKISKVTQIEPKETESTVKTKPSALKLRKSVEDALECSDVTHSVETVNKIPEETQKKLKEKSESKTTKKSAGLKLKISLKDALKFTNTTHNENTVKIPEETKKQLKQSSKSKTVMTKLKQKSSHNMETAKTVESKAETAKPTVVNVLENTDSTHIADAVKTSEDTFGNSNTDTHNEKAVKAPEKTQQKLNELPESEKESSSTKSVALKRVDSTFSANTPEDKIPKKEKDVDARRKSTEIVEKRKRKSIDVTNEVTATEIEQSAPLKNKLENKVTQMAKEPKLVMKVRRLSIDETNLKVTLEKSSEIIEKTSKHSKKHNKRFRKSQRRLSVEKSTETNDMARWDESRKEEFTAVKDGNSQTDIVELKKSTPSSATTITIETEKLPKEKVDVVDPVVESILVRVKEVNKEIVKPVNDLKEQTNDMIVEITKPVDSFLKEMVKVDTVSVVESVKKSKSKANELELATTGHTSIVEPIQESKAKANELELATTDHTSAVETIQESVKESKKKANELGLATTGHSSAVELIQESVKESTKKASELGLPITGVSSAIEPIQESVENKKKEANELGLATTGNTSVVEPIQEPVQESKAKVNELELVITGHNSAVELIQESVKESKNKVNDLGLAAKGNASAVEPIPEPVQESKAKANELGLATMDNTSAAETIPEPVQESKAKANELELVITGHNSAVELIQESVKESKNKVNELGLAATGNASAVEPIPEPVQESKLKANELGLPTTDNTSAPEPVQESKPKSDELGLAITGNAFAAETIPEPVQKSKPKADELGLATTDNTSAAETIPEPVQKSKPKADELRLETTGNTSVVEPISEPVKGSKGKANELELPTTDHTAVTPIQEPVRKLKTKPNELELPTIGNTSVMQTIQESKVKVNELELPTTSLTSATEAVQGSVKELKTKADELELQTTSHTSAVEHIQEPVKKSKAKANELELPTTAHNSAVELIQEFVKESKAKAGELELSTSSHTSDMEPIQESVKKSKTKADELDLTASGHTSEIESLREPVKESNTKADKLKLATTGQIFTVGSIQQLIEESKTKADELELATTEHTFAVEPIAESVKESKTKADELELATTGHPFVVVSFQESELREKQIVSDFTKSSDLALKKVAPKITATVVSETEVNELKLPTTDHTSVVKTIQEAKKSEKQIASDVTQLSDLELRKAKPEIIETVAAEIKLDSNLLESNKSTAIRDLEKISVKEKILEPVVSTSVQDTKEKKSETISCALKVKSEQKSCAKPLKLICRIARLAEKKLQPTAPTIESVAVTKATTLIESPNSTHSSDVTSVVEAIQDPKGKIVDLEDAQSAEETSAKETIQSTKSADPVERHMPKSLKKKTTSSTISPKVQEVPRESKTPSMKTNPTKSQCKRKRVSLDCNRSLTSSPISLRTRSHSMEVSKVVHNEIPFKKMKLQKASSRLILEETATQVDESQKASTPPAESLESVEIKIEANPKDEVQRQLELSIKNILGNQLSETDEDNSSVTMSKILLTKQPQGFDSVPDDIFAGNGDTSDNLETKFYPKILKPEDLMPKSTHTEESHRTDESDAEASNVKLNGEHIDNDSKEPPLKKSNSERENDESVNQSEGDSTQELELDPFAMPNIADINANSSTFEENYFPEVIVQSDCLTDDIDAVINDLPFLSSDCMISGNDAHKYYKPLYLLDSPLLILEQENEAMDTVSPFDVLLQIRKSNVAESFPNAKNEVSTDFEIDFENELLTCSDLVGNSYSTANNGKNHSKCTTSTSVKIDEPKPGQSDDSVFKKPNSIHISTENPTSDVPQQTALNYYAPPVEVSTEVGFESLDELLADNNNFFSSSDSRKRSPSCSENETELGKETSTPLLAANPSEESVVNVESNEFKPNEQTPDPQIVSGLEKSCELMKPSLMADNITENKFKESNATKRLNDDIAKSSSDRKKICLQASTSKQETISSQTNRQKLFARNCLPKSKAPIRRNSQLIVKPKLVTPIPDVKANLNVQNTSNLSDEKLNSTTEAVRENSAISTRDITMKEYRTENVPPKGIMTKLPDLSADLSPVEPPNKKPRIEAISRLSTDDLFDRLKRESPVNPLMRKLTLKKSSSFDTDDNSSRDSASGLLTAATSPCAAVTNVMCPATTWRESPIPTLPTSPGVLPSMPLISTPPRLESSPKITEFIDEPMENISEPLIESTLSPPILETVNSDTIDNISLSNTSTKRHRTNNDMEKVLEAPVKSSSSPCKSPTLLPPKSQSDKLITLPYPIKLECAVKPVPAPVVVSSKAEVKSTAPRVTFSPLLTKIPEVNPFMLRPISSASGSPSQPHKPIKSILTSSKPSSSLSNLSSPSESPKSVKSILAPPKLSSSTLDADSPPQSQKLTKSIPTKSSSSSATLDVGSHYLSQKSVKPIPTPAKLSSSSPTLDVGSPSQSQKTVKPILTPAKLSSSSATLDVGSPSQSQKSTKSVPTPAKSSSSSATLDVGSPSQSQKSVKTILTPAKLSSSSATSDVGSPSESQKSIKPISTPAKLSTSLATLDVGSLSQKSVKPISTSSKLSSSSAMLDVGSPSQSQKSVKLISTPAKLSTSSATLDVGSPSQSQKSVKTILTPAKLSSSSATSDVGSPSQSQKSIKHISTPAKLSTSSATLDVGSLSQKSVKPISTSSKLSSSSATLDVGSPSQSQKSVKLISTPAKLSSSSATLDVGSPSQSQKSVKLISTPAKLSSSSATLDVGSPSQSQKSVKPISTPSKLSSSSATLDVGSPSKSQKSVKPISIPAKSLPSSAALSVGSPSSNQKSVKPIPIPAKMLSSSTALNVSSSSQSHKLGRVTIIPLKSSSSRSDTGYSPSLSKKPVKSILASPPPVLVHRNTPTMKSTPTSRRTPSTTPTPVTPATSRSSPVVDHAKIIDSLTKEIDALSDNLKKLPEVDGTYAQHKNRKRLLELHEMKLKQLVEFKNKQSHGLASKSRSYSERQPLDSHLNHRPAVHSSQRESKCKEHRPAYVNKFAVLKNKGFEIAERSEERASTSRESKTLPSWDPIPASTEKIIADLNLKKSWRNN